MKPTGGTGTAQTVLAFCGSTQEAAMRRAGALTILVVIAALLFGVAWPLLSILRIGQAAQRNDGAAVAAGIDFPRLQRSISTQVIATLTGGERFRKLGPVQQGFAASAANIAIVSRLEQWLTPDNAVQLFGRGEVKEGPVAGNISIPSLSDLSREPLFDWLGRYQWIDPMTVGFDLGGGYAIHLRFEGTGWQVAALVLPEGVLQEIARRIQDQVK